MLQISIFAHFQVDFDVTIVSDSKTKNMEVYGIYHVNYGDRRKSATFNFQNLFNNQLYIFEPYNGGANLNISNYDFPQSTDTTKYIIPTNYPLTIDSFPDTVKHRVDGDSYYSTIYNMNTLQPLHFNNMNLSFTCTEAYTTSSASVNPYIKVVWAELK